MQLVSITSAAKILGVSPQTLRLWDAAAKLRPEYRTAGGHRRYSTEQLHAFIRTHHERQADPAGS